MTPLTPRELSEIWRTRSSWPSAVITALFCRKEWRAWRQAEIEADIACAAADRAEARLADFVERIVLDFALDLDQFGQEDRNG